MEQGKRGAVVRALVGGPGTGKTTQIVDRAVASLRDGAPSVIVIARDRRAARGLRERILAAVPATDAVTVTTFHALALGVLRRGWRVLGADGPPALISGPEQFALVKELLDAPGEQERWSSFPKARTLVGFVNEVREFVLRVQDADEDPDTLEQRARLARRPELQEAARAFRRYLDLLDARNLVDHANAICQATTLLSPDEADDPNAAAAREILISQTSGGAHLFVDDGHAASPAMLNLLRRLADPAASVLVAIDPAAPTFAFRGGVEDVQQSLSRRFPEVEVIELDTRLRPTPRVIGIRALHAVDEVDALVHQVASSLAGGGLRADQVAVVVRRLGPDADMIRRALERAGIPVSMVGENRALHAEPALQPLLDLITVATSVADRDETLPRVLASPIGGLGPVRFRALVHFAQRRGTTMDVLFAAPDDDIPDGLRTPLLAVRALVDDLTEREQTDRADTVAWWLWERLDHHRELVARGDDRALDALVGFHDALARYCDRHSAARLGEFVEMLRAADFGAEPVGPAEPIRDAVRVLTAHAALGDEAEIVFVPGCVDGAYPDLRERTFALDASDLLAPTAPAERQVRRAQNEQRLFEAILARGRALIVCSYARESVDGRVRSPSPLALRAGVRFEDAVRNEDAFTRDGLEALHRRRLTNPRSNDADRVASLEMLSRLPGVDPDTWWYERDWTDPGQPLHTGQLRTSQSRFSSYEDCALRYLLNTECGLDQDTSSAMAFGSLIHGIIEDASIESMETQQVPLLEDLLADLKQRWDPTIFDNAALEHRRRLDAIDMLTRWADTDASDFPLAVEAEFAFEHGPALVRGKIDRIVSGSDGRTRVTDYKTGRSYKSKDEIQEDLQLGVYFLAMRRMPHLVALGDPIEVELATLGVQQANGGIHRSTFKPPAEFEAEIVERLDGIFEGIMSEQFAPNPGSDCRYCKFKPLCPLWPEGQEVAL